MNASETPSRGHEAQRFFEQPERYLSGGFQIPTRARIVREMIPSAHGAAVLDLGCGDGTLSLQFAFEARQVTLVDFSGAVLARARKKIPPDCFQKVSIVEADLLSCDSIEPAEVVICVGVAAHIDDLPCLIKRLASVTKPEGECVFQITDFDRWTGRLQWYREARASRKSRGQKYELQRTSFVRVVEMAASEGLEYRRRRDHCLVLPGMGRLPRKWIVAFDSLVLGTRLLARVAPSSLLLFRKH